MPPSTLTSWALLIVAGLLEACWAIGLKSSHGFTRLWPSVWTGTAIVVSMVLLSLAARTIPIGTAYAVWVGIGTAGTVLLAAGLFDEKLTIGKLGLIGLLLASIVGLKLTSQPTNGLPTAAAESQAEE